MVKHVDAGHEDPSSSRGGKKKAKKGFKVDRRANYERMLARKLAGKEAKRPAEKRPTRVKSVLFDDNARREYLLTLHKKKNERRVQAFVDMKKKLRKDNARTRQQQREEARRAYNSYAKTPILPNYTFRLPNYLDNAMGGDSNGDEEEEEEEEADSGSDSSSKGSRDDSEWVYTGSSAGEEVPQGEEEEEERHEEEVCRRTQLKEKLRLRKLAVKSKSTHVMPASMTSSQADDDSHPHRAEKDTVTVEVKPLLGSRGALTEGGGQKATPSLPSQDFSDLPAVVEQELRRLRQETKGPSRTKPRLHLMKELEKIRKIKKHSRKGHGKRKASGKRKTRSKK